MCNRIEWWWWQGSAPCSLVTWHRPCCSDSPSHYPPTSQLQQQLSPGQGQHSTAHLSNTTQLRAVTRGNLIVASTPECGQATQLLPSSNLFIIYPHHQITISSWVLHSIWLLKYESLHCLRDCVTTEAIVMWKYYKYCVYCVLYSAVQCSTTLRSARDNVILMRAHSSPLILLLPLCNFKNLCKSDDGPGKILYTML